MVALNWKVTGQWSAASDCGQYRIVKGIVQAKPRYVPYYVGGERSEMLSNGVMTVEAAKTICETHYKAKNGIRQSEPMRTTARTANIAEGSDAEKGKGTSGN